MIHGIYYLAELRYEAKKLICCCSISVYGPYPSTDWSKGYVGICNSCKNPRIHALYNCDICEQYFVKDFKHPGFCWKNPICFYCLPADAWCKHCEEYCPPLFHSTIEPPLRKKIIATTFDPLQEFNL